MTLDLSRNELDAETYEVRYDIKRKYLYETVKYDVPEAPVEAECEAVLITCVPDTEELYRPGPMDYIPDFIDRKHGRKPIEYDIDLMEKFGIYEVIEEDLVLCEYVCPSKIYIQQIITDGIALMLKEMC